MSTRTNIVILLLCGLLWLSAWAGDDLNLPRNQTRVPALPIATEATSEGSGITRSPEGQSDIIPGPIPVTNPQLFVADPPIIICATETVEPPLNPTPLWGEDFLIWGTHFASPSGHEHMISFDYATDSTLYAAAVVSSGDTAWIYHSTDGGAHWNRWNGIYHTGNVLSSIKVIVAEGDSNFVYLFAKSSANAGDIYVGRWWFDGTHSHIFSALVGPDTIANFTVTKDTRSGYYLYIAYELRGGGNPYNAKTLRSTNFGSTWQDNSGDILDTQTPPIPDICYGAGGNVYMTCLDKRQSSRPDTTSFRLKISRDFGNTWEQSRQVGTPIVPVSDGHVAASHSLPPSIWLVHVRDMDPFNGMGLGVFYYNCVSNDTIWRYGGDDGIGHADTDNNERLPSISANRAAGAITVSYSIVPSESLMFTWSYTSNDTHFDTPIKINNHRHTGNFSSAAGWRYWGGYFSTVVYAGVGPDSLWFDSWDNATGIAKEQPITRPTLNTRLAVTPNIAKHSLTVNYLLSEPGHITLDVFAASGRMVTTLVNCPTTAGVHALNWDVTKVPIGVYICRLMAENRSITKRFIVVR